MSEWISVKDEMPPEETIVLVFDSFSQRIGRLCYKKHEGKLVWLIWGDKPTWFIPDGKKYDFPSDITYWMPYCGDPDPII